MPCSLSCGAMGTPSISWEMQNVERYERAMVICLNDPGVDGLLVIFTSPVRRGPEELAAAVVKIAGPLRNHHHDLDGRKDR